MLTLEDVLCELSWEEMSEQGLQPGFRFHPTDEELITFYLASKVFNGSFCGMDIAEVDLNRCEPWDLPEVAKMGEREWYLFSLRDRKYPTGLRTNRATGAGYWKATGKDREIYSTKDRALLGMKKTLVFYRGRAPRGHKTRWVMHEYRLGGNLSYRHTCKEWVICRIYHRMTGDKRSAQIQGQLSYVMLQQQQQQHQLREGSLLPQLLQQQQQQQEEVGFPSKMLSAAGSHQSPSFLLDQQSFQAMNEGCQPSYKHSTHKQCKSLANLNHANENWFVHNTDQDIIHSRRPHIIGGAGVGVSKFSTYTPAVTDSVDGVCMETSSDSKSIRFSNTTSHHQMMTVDPLPHHSMAVLVDPAWLSHHP